jgi:hypothetical protein
MAKPWAMPHSNNLVVDYYVIYMKALLWHFIVQYFVFKLSYLAKEKAHLTGVEDNTPCRSDSPSLLAAQKMTNNCRRTM